MQDNVYGSYGSDMQGTTGGGTDQTFAADLSRGAWDTVAAAPTAQQKPENQVIHDNGGHITEVIHPDGTIYDYSNFQPNGQPSQVRITDSKTGDFGQWKREDDGLWRSYNQDKPNYEVVRGEWVVDNQGTMHMQGSQGTKELPPQITRDAEGHITRSKHEDGTVYDYSKFDENGQPTVCKISDPKKHDWGYWKKEDDHLWRSYDKEKPNYEVLKGDWTVDKNGVMHMDGIQDTKEKPPQIKYDAAMNITQVRNNDGSIYDYSKFDDNGQPTVCKITDSKTGNWGYWKKEGDHLWRSYDKEKPNYEVLRGDWTVDENGVMHMDGIQDSLPLPSAARRPAAPHPAPDSQPPSNAKPPSDVQEPSNAKPPSDVQPPSSAQPPSDVQPPSNAQPSDKHPHRTHAAKQIGPGPDGVPSGPPEGYRYLRSRVTPAIVTEAKSLLGGAYGTETPFEIDGKKYMARVEPHPPENKPGLDHWHKGVTVYEAKNQS